MNKVLVAKNLHYHPPLRLVQGKGRSLGTFSFAATGVFAAMEKRLDAFGVFIISFATAIGGGTIWL